MTRTILLLLGLFLLLVGTAPRTFAQTPEIVIPIGVKQTIAVQNVDGARVENIHIAHIERLGSNEVMISATGVGKTSLELTRRQGGGPKRFVLHVVPASNTRTRTVLSLASESQVGGAPDTNGDAHPDSAVSEGNAATKEMVAKLDASSTQTNSAVATNSSVFPSPIIASPRDDSSFVEKLEFSSATVFSYDAERVRIVNLNPEALEGATGDARLVAARQRDETITIRRSAIVTPLSFSFDLNSRNSLTLTIPFIRRRDELVIGGVSYKSTASGLGDAQLNFESRYPRIRNSAWTGLFGLNFGFPTGKNIYTLPPDQSPLGIGHFEIGSTVGARRIFDPVSFNAAVGVSYFLPRTVEGRTVSPGFGYSLQSGIGYALTDRWVFGEQLEFIRSPNVLTTTPLDSETVATDQVILGHSFTYRPKGGHALQMMFNIGLTPASSDYRVGFSYSYRRNPKP